MEFINPYKQDEKETKEFCSEQDIKALSKEFSTTETGALEHQSDNSFLESSYGKTCDNMRRRGYQMIGICQNAPWYRNNCYSAIVFEDIHTFEKYWCHTNDTITNWWRGQANV